MPTNSYFFSSSTKSGAQNVSLDGSSFEVNFNSPLSIPAEAKLCEVAVASAAIWNVSPNISALFGNNQITITHWGYADTLVITDGLYSIDSLNEFINRGLSNPPFNIAPGSFVISGDQSTQRSVVTILTPGDNIDFGGLNSVGSILGFDPIIVTATAANEHFYSNREASFNRNNLYCITSDLVTSGLPVNGLMRSVIGIVLITADPGFQDSYNPNQLQWSNANNLIGLPRMNVRFSLLNQNLEAVPTAGETYSFVLIIRYE